MRRRSALFAVVLILAMTIGPGAMLADSTRPSFSPIGEDDFLTLYGFTFDQFEEIPWDRDEDQEPDPFEATMTVYVVDGTFAFFGEGAVVKLPLDSDCLELQTAVVEGNELYYEPNTPAQEIECVPNCPDICALSALALADPLQAVILKAGTVLFLPADTPCFVCAIGASAAYLDVTVRTDAAGDSWTRDATLDLEATPGSESTPAAIRLGKLPMRNPGGCAGRF